MELNEKMQLIFLLHLKKVAKNFSSIKKKMQIVFFSSKATPKGVACFCFILFSDIVYFPVLPDRHNGPNPRLLHANQPVTTSNQLLRPEPCARRKRNLI